MSMAQVIRAAMKKQGVTVSQLSRQLGCTPKISAAKCVVIILEKASYKKLQRRSAVGLRVVLFQKKQESQLNNIPVSWVGKLLQRLTHSAVLRLF